jgi:hypothetical protein
LKKDLYGARLKLMKKANPFKMGCTAGFCGPNASKDKGSYLFWNIDFLGAALIIKKIFRLYLVDIKGKNSYLAYGIPGFINVPIINEFGLSVVGASIGMKDGGGNGLSDAEILPLCIERAKDIGEVIDIYKKNKLYSFAGISGGSLLNLNTIWADINGGGVAIEHTSHHLHFALATEGILAIANHHQFLDRNLTGSPSPRELPLIAGSYCRLNRMWHLLRQNKGKIELALIKKIMADHKKEKASIDDDTICVHYWHIKKYLRQGNIKEAIRTYLIGKTIGSLIIEPKKLAIHIASGNPCTNPYRFLSLKEVFRNKKFPLKMTKPISPKRIKLLKNSLKGLATFLEKTVPV